MCVCVCAHTSVASTVVPVPVGGEDMSELPWGVWGGMGGEDVSELHEW